MTHKTCEIDGKRIAYYEGATDFLVQVGKGKSSYKTRYKFTNPGQAFLYYQGLNVHSGYKKRLLMPSCSRNPVIAREITQ